MRLNKLFITSLFLAVLTVSCEKDDDEPEIIPERDRAEQEVEDQEALEEYLATHFYNYEEFENPSESFDYVVRVDTINETNADKIPLIESELLEKKTITRNEVDYTIYFLKVREGEGEQPKFTDDIYFTYRGELLNRQMFDNSMTPVWFNLLETIPGYSFVFPEFKGASGFEVNEDNTITWENDFGIGAVFMPSGMGYFSQSKDKITAYSPLVFSFQLLGVKEADHDNDGVPSWMEDLNGDGIITNDDTDGDGRPNYADADDDGDFIPTREEIMIDEDGNLSFPDKDGDGIPDYLDPEN